MLDERRLRRILEVGRTVVSELDLETVLQRVLEEARALTGARYAALGILDDDRRELDRFLTVGVDPQTHAAIGDLPRGRGVLGVLISDPEPLRLRDVGEHPRSYGFPVGHPPMRSFLGVPILIRGQAFGNLYLADKEGADEFDADDEEAIVLLSSWAAVAIDNARAYREEHARRGELELAVRALEATTTIARAVGGETDLDRVLELIAKRARALVEARGLLILLRDGAEMTVAAVAGDLGDDLPGTRVPVEGSVSGGVLRDQRPERLSDLAGRLRFTLAEQVHARTGLMVPLVFRGRAVGVLAAFDRGEERAEFTAEDERLLESFAASAATAVATAQDVAAQGLRRSIESSERERQHWARELHDETLQELGALKILLAGARRRNEDPATGDALDRAVAQLGESIAGLRRLIADLRPAALGELGVQAALEGLTERVAETSGLKVVLAVALAHGADADRPAPVLEDALYRIVQEALTNVVKHAGAASVEVRATEGEDGHLTLTVTDDGVGVDPDRPTDGFGLIGMRERVALAGGAMTLERGPRGGTIVRATFPGARARRLGSGGHGR
jgi:two-component system, NarL family, sensor histidine kinase DevS